MAEVRSEILITPEAVASFLNVFRPNPKQKTKDGRPKYTLTLIFKPAAQKTAGFKALKKAVEDVAHEKWGDELPKKLKRPFLTTDDLEKVPTGLDEEDVFIRLSAINKPGIVDQKKAPILDEGDMYAGCFIRCSVQAYTWVDEQGGKGVSFGLNNIQKVRDGDHLAGGSRAEDDFDELEVADTDDLLD
ncbi:DUF2815 family protein [Pseudomonas sp. PDM21]|uniref:ssDNA-binding protein n=1 Tax=Pseudomonas sp. PDM21 TaxID=2769257 RepID=UPI00177FB133|nr:ssDNA-binding protein [Pseudomonas sp. PDM21]MBD9674938.1 DUF2815 family protein [Pseudomonas sp. PDM21]